MASTSVSIDDEKLNEVDKKLNVLKVQEEIGQNVTRSGLMRELLTAWVEQRVPCPFRSEIPPGTFNHGQLPEQWSVPYNTNNDTEQEQDSSTPADGG